MHALIPLLQLNKDRVVTDCNDMTSEISSKFDNDLCKAPELADGTSFE
jgi:hypothetical protein